MRATLALVALLATLPSPAQARPAPAPARAGPYSVELTDQHGRVLPTFTEGGRTYVLGARGDRYLVRVRNQTWRRAEVVVSVDGRDVLDGEPSAFSKRGYLVEPHGTLTIDGFRLSDAAVAAFRFSSVARSYAAQRGDARDVGVIGVAVFPERTPPPRPQPRPWWPGEPDGWRGDDEGSGLRSQEAPAAPPAPSAAPGRDRSEAADASAEAAPRSSSGQAEQRADRRPGLGTEFGERHASHVREVPFERASSQPEVVLSLRYDDRRGLLALGIDVDGRRAADEARLRESADPFRRDARYAQPPPGWRQ